MDHRWYSRRRIALYLVAAAARSLAPSPQLDGDIMQWYVYLAFFLGGALFANAIPHLIAGIAGQPFQSPFASPPFIGLSSPTVNVAWALVNLAVAYLLLVRAGPLDLRNWSDAAACFVGFGTMALQCARSLARLRKNTVT